MVDVAEMGVGVRIERIRQGLLRGEALDEADRRFVARLLLDLVVAPSQSRQILLRAEALRQRDAALCRLATRLDVGSARAKAAAIASMARRYQASARWQTDRHAVACPPDIKGTHTELLWLALAALPKIPTEDHLRKIIAASG